VESLAREVTDAGGNWLESRMAHLAGQFAGIVQVEIAREGTPALQAALERFRAAGGFQLSFAESQSAGSATGLRTARLEILGHDRPGIVREISHAIASRGANVEEFSSEIRIAPMSGDPLFHAVAILALPPDFDLSILRLDLERIAEDLMVEATLAE
jgi:glycine cleavage system regulatory protein